MDLMPRPRPPGLHQERSRHGKTIWYVRVDRGKRVRIRGEYGSDEFKQAVRDALAGTPPAAAGNASKGTLAWLWGVYRGSSAWADLSSATRRQRENIMRDVIEKAGKKRLANVTRQSVVLACDKRKPYQARHMVDCLRAMFKWAIYSELAKFDPTEGVKTRKPRSEGFPVWSEDEIARFEDRWPRGTRERVIFDIFLYTGLRRGDAAQLGRQHVRDGVISIVTEKTGMRVTIPMLAELKVTLDAGPTGDLAFIATEAGNPMTKESMANTFRRACRDAGIRKSGHGLRKAAATHAANRGATEAQLEAIFGWSGGKMAALYTRSANRQTLALDATAKLSRLGSERK